MNALLEQAKKNDADDTVGGGDFETFLHPEGPTLGRFVGYVEVGLRKQPPWKGQDKKPASEARFTFELNGPQSKRMITPEGEEPYEVPCLIRLKLPKKGGDKSSYVKLMRKMAYGRDVTNFAVMLGEPFLIAIKHGEGQDRDGNKKTYHNMRDSEGTFLIGAAMMKDPLSGETKRFAVEEAVTPLSYLSWDNPTKEQWSSIFIDGERTVKDKEGVESIESKNWLQRDIVTGAINFSGSPLEAMLNGLEDLDMPSENPEETGLSADEEKDMKEAEFDQAMAVGAVDKLAEQATEDRGEDKASLAADAVALEAIVAVAKSAAAAVGLKEPEEVASTVADDKAKQIADARAIIEQLMAVK